MKVENINYIEYSLLEDKKEFDFAVKYGSEFAKENDFFKIGDFLELDFGTIKELQDSQLTYNQYFNFISKVKKIPLRKIVRNSMINIIQSINYFNSQMKQINMIESMKLVGIPANSDELAAGIENFNALGNYMQFQALTKGDVTKYEKVYNTRYSICFLELYAQKIFNEYQYNLMKIQQRRNGN